MRAQVWTGTEFRDSAELVEAWLPVINDHVGPEIPDGVTLVQIDGGPTYFADHGFIYAAERGWDDPNFFPIGTWYSKIHDQAAIDLLLDLNCNTCFRVEGSADLPLAEANGLSVILDWAREGGEIPMEDVGAETVGLLSFDEPVSYTEGWVTPLSSAPNSLQDHRFWHVQMTWNWLVYKDTSGIPAATAMSNLIDTPNATQRHMDIQSADIYWFAATIENFVAVQAGPALYDIDSPMPESKYKSGGPYGDMIDTLRPYQADHYPAPIWNFVENGGPWTEDTLESDYITPPELNWAAWSNIIHGARALMYFNHTFAGPAESNNNFGTGFYQSPRAGQTVSIYDQAKATNALILQMAPAINAPRADGYLEVDPPAEDFAGIDTRVTYRTDTDTFTIFAITREEKGAGSVEATFTTAGGYTGPVTVVGESRTVTATGGEFTDTFSSEATVHIYEVPNS